MRILSIRVLGRRISDRQRRRRRVQIAKELKTEGLRHPERKIVLIVARRWGLAPRTIYAILAGDC